MKAIANVVTSMTAGDWPRKGRKTTRSISIDRATTTTKHAEDETDPDGHERVDGAEPDRIHDRLRIEGGQHAHDAR
jgi:hypothetical protein